MNFVHDQSCIDTNDGTGSLSYSASSCVSEDSSVPEDKAFLSSFLAREHQTHVEEQKLARRARSLRESPQREGSASDSLDDDAAYNNYCRIGNSLKESGQTSDNKRHDGGTRSNSLHPRLNKKSSFGSSPATVTASDSSLRSNSKGSSRKSVKRILSDPKNEVWYERLLCGMNSNC